MPALAEDATRAEATRATAETDFMWGTRKGEREPPGEAAAAERESAADPDPCNMAQSGNNASITATFSRIFWRAAGISRHQWIRGE